MGRYQEAFEAYGRVIKLQPDEPNGPLGASSMLLLLNRPDDARAHAELAIGSAPSQAHRALALIAVSRQRDDEALRQADLAAAAEPGLPMPAFIRGTSPTTTSNTAGARIPAPGAERLRGPQRAAEDLHFMIGDSLARLERYKEAEPCLEEEPSLPSTRSRSSRPRDALSIDGTQPRPSGRLAISCVMSPRPTQRTRPLVSGMFGRPDRADSVADEARRRRRER